MNWDELDPSTDGLRKIGSSGSSESSLDELFSELELDLFLEDDNPSREHLEASGAASCLQGSSEDNDEMPQDIHAFFGHPLNGDDTQASALALLHEYQNLPAIDKNNIKIGEKYGSLIDILKFDSTKKEKANEAAAELPKEDDNNNKSNNASPDPVSLGRAKNQNGNDQKSEEVNPRHKSAFDTMLLSKDSPVMTFFQSNEDEDQQPDSVEQELHSQLIDRIQPSPTPEDSPGEVLVGQEGPHGDILQQAMQSEDVNLQTETSASISGTLKAGSLLSDDSDHDLIPKDVVHDPSMLTMNLGSEGFPKSSASTVDRPSQPKVTATRRRCRRKATRVSRRIPVANDEDEQLPSSVTSPGGTMFCGTNSTPQQPVYSMNSLPNNTKTLPDITETFKRDSPLPQPQPSTPSAGIATQSVLAASHSNRGDQNLPVKQMMPKLHPAFMASSNPAAIAASQPEPLNTTHIRITNIPNHPPIKSEDSPTPVQAMVPSPPTPSPMVSIAVSSGVHTMIQAPVSQLPVRYPGLPSPVYSIPPPATGMSVPIPAPRPPSPYVLLGPGQELPEGYVHVPPPHLLGPPGHHPYAHMSPTADRPPHVSSPMYSLPVSNAVNKTACEPANLMPVSSINPAAVSASHVSLTATSPLQTAAIQVGITGPSVATNYNSTQPKVSHCAMPVAQVPGVTPVPGQPVLPTYAMPSKSRNSAEHHPHPPMMVMSPEGVPQYLPPGYSPFYQLPNGQVVQHPGLMMPMPQAAQPVTASDPTKPDSSVASSSVGVKPPSVVANEEAIEAKDKQSIEANKHFMQTISDKLKKQQRPDEASSPHRSTDLTLQTLPAEPHSGKSTPLSAVGSAPCTPNVLSAPNTPVSFLPASKPGALQNIPYPPVASVQPISGTPSSTSQPMPQVAAPVATSVSSSMHYIPMYAPPSVSQGIPQLPSPVTHGGIASASLSSPPHQSPTVPTLIHHYPANLSPNVLTVPPGHSVPMSAAPALANQPKTIASTQASHAPPKTRPAQVSHMSLPVQLPPQGNNPPVHQIPVSSPTIPQASVPPRKVPDASRNLASESPMAPVPIGHIPPMGMYRPTMGAMFHCDLRSPDSGYGDSLTSPAEHRMVPSISGIEVNSEESPGILGKRRSSSSSSTKQNVMASSTAGPPVKSSSVVIPKLEPDLSGYRYYLETNISTTQRINEDRITYLNKGQFYGLVLEYKPTHRMLPWCSTVKSIIMVVFREEKSVQDEVKAWDFWYSRQHSIKMRILDVDTKNSEGIVAQCIEEIAHNAVAIRWNPLEQPAKINIAINCLSTDFSNQKGVKGLPLHIQVDTFEDISSRTPIHRGYCQVKVFCDKGAERKTRDEERRKDKTKPGESGRSRGDEFFHPPTEISEFYAMAELTKPPVFFTPVADPGELTSKSSPLDMSMYEGNVPTLGPEEQSLGMPPAVKRMRSSSVGAAATGERVLLYVREAHETVFTAVLLHQPTVLGLSQAIEEKYHILSSKIKNIFKRSRKGILVKMDENILKHYSNESAFIISMQKNEPNLNTASTYDVTLSEIDIEVK